MDRTMKSGEQKHLILVVDDEPRNLQVVGLQLRGVGLDAAVAINGREALEKAESLEPDLILLDVMMPFLDGYEVCRRLKANPATAEIPVIFLTAKAESEDIVMGFKAGGLDYVTKPFNSEELLARVDTHLQLRDTQKRLKEANMAKDKFFSIIAHDLRGPLGAVKDFLRVIMSDFEGCKREDLFRFLSEILKEVTLTFNFLENLLEWARSQTGRVKPNPTDLNVSEIIDDCIGICNAKAKNKNIGIHKNAAYHLTAYADKNMVTTVVRNLIDNAVKFTPAGGEIHIKACEADSMIEVEIRDSGVGMDGDVMGSLFRLDKSVTTMGTENEKGTGLGLILCKDFIEKNNGRISVWSEQGKGSAFVVTLPMASAPSPEMIPV